MLLIVERLSSPNQMTEWIAMCIKSIKYSVVVNGKISRKFETKKGSNKGHFISNYVYHGYGVIVSYVTRCHIGENFCDPI